MELVKDETNRNLGRKKQVCRICGLEGRFQSWLSREMMQGTKEEFEYFECPVCRCLQIAEVPEDLGKYYGDDYYSFSGKKELNDTPVTNMDKILDVGCGNGAWLVACANAGYGNLYGCDPFLKKDIQYGDRIHICSCSIHDIEGENSFDVIRFGDSFEHVIDPLNVLQSAEKLLKQDGVIKLHIPAFPNAAFEMFGPYWYQLDAPRHITLHSKNSIACLAKKTRLRIAKIEYDSDYSWFYRSFFYERGFMFSEIDAELIRKYFSQDEINSIEEMCRTFNDNGQGDHMVVYLIKNKY